MREDPRNIEYLRAFVAAGYALSAAESIETDRDGLVLVDTGFGAAQCATPTTVPTSCASISSRYGPTVSNTRSMAAALSSPAESTPSPSRVTSVRRSISSTRPSATSAIRRLVEFVPRSTTAILLTASTPWVLQPQRLSRRIRT